MSSDPLDLAGEVLARHLDGHDVAADLAALPPELRDEVAAAIDAQRAIVGRPLDLRPHGVRGDGRFGPYRILRLLGRGGQGTIFLAEDTRAARQVALKVLDRVHSGEGERLARLLREARLVARLDHPGICTVYETGMADGSAFIAMSYVEGETLAQALEGQRGRAPDVARWLRVLEQAATTLHAAHEAGIVHRDLKPANLMLTPQGGVVILDFGLAADAALASLTASGATFGTPAYMAPEQIAGGRRRPDRRTDVWALGAILHEAVTGTRPFARTGRESLYHSILTEEPSDPLLLNPRLPPDVRVVLQTALAKSPGDRYRTALDLAEDLRRIRADLPIRARASGPGQRALRWFRRNRKLGAALAGVFVSLCLGLCSALLLLADARHERDRATLALTAERKARLRSESTALLARSQVVAGRDPAGALEMALAAAEHAPTQLVQDTLLKLLERADLDRVLVGHDGPVLDAAFSPDGGRAATASADGTARIWDVRSGRTLAVHRLGPGAARAVAWHPQGDRVAAAGDDGVVRVVSAESGLVGTSFAAHRTAITSLAWHPGGRLLLTASRDGAAATWDFATGTEVVRFTGHRGSVTRAAFDRSGERVVTASEDRTARVWSVAGGSASAVLEHGLGSVVDACFSPDGSRLLTACEDNTAWMWDVATCAVIERFEGHESAVLGVAFEPAGDGFATGSTDRTVRLWPRSSAAGPRPLTGHRRAVNRIAFAPDGGSLISASEDASARVWLTRPRPELAVLPHGSWATTSAVFSRDGKRIATTSEQASVRIWSLETGRAVRTLAGHGAPVTCARFGPGDRLLATGSADGTARIFEVATGTGLHVLRIPELAGEAQCGVEWSPGGETLLVTTSAGAAALFDVRTGALRQRLEGMAPFHATGIVTRSAFSADGRLVATVRPGEDRNRVAVWDTQSGAMVRRLAGHTSVVYSLEFAPSGRRIVTTSYDRTARIWDVDGGGEPIVLRGHDEGVLDATFDQRGERIVTSGMDGVARVWDAWTGRELCALRGHDALIYCASFSPDGRSVVTGSWDGTASLWDVAGGGRLLVQEAHRRPVLSACFSPDGSSVLSAGLDGCARVWPVDPLALARRLCVPVRGVVEPAR